MAMSLVNPLVAVCELKFSCGCRVTASRSSLLSAAFFGAQEPGGPESRNRCVCDKVAASGRLKDAGVVLSTLVAGLV